MGMRVTSKMLTDKVQSLNNWAGFPNGAWVKDGDKYKAVIGAYVLDGTYGGYKLCRIVGEGGGEREITMRNSARVTLELISAYWQGLQEGKR